MARPRKPLYGVGINDADYVVWPGANRKGTRCHFYNIWSHMICRGYSESFKENSPSYKDVSVCDDWHSFMNFREWMAGQNWQGKELDKDIINPGNKIYSPENCCFVGHGINSMITDTRRTRGKYPRGVNILKPTGRFRATCWSKNKTVHLGCFSTPELAHATYCKYKSSLIKASAEKVIDQRVKAGLIKHAMILEAACG